MAPGRIPVGHGDRQLGPASGTIPLRCPSAQQERHLPLFNPERLLASSASRHYAGGCQKDGTRLRSVPGLKVTVICAVPFERLVDAM